MHTRSSPGITTLYEHDQEFDLDRILETMLDIQSREFSLQTRIDLYLNLCKEVDSLVLDEDCQLIFESQPHFSRLPVLSRQCLDLKSPRKLIQTILAADRPFLLLQRQIQSLHSERNSVFGQYVALTPMSQDQDQFHIFHNKLQQSKTINYSNMDRISQALRAANIRITNLTDWLNVTSLPPVVKPTQTMTSFIQDRVNALLENSALSAAQLDRLRRVASLPQTQLHSSSRLNAFKAILKPSTIPPCHDVHYHLKLALSEEMNVLERTTETLRASTEYFLANEIGSLYLNEQGDLVFENTAEITPRLVRDFAVKRIQELGADLDTLKTLIDAMKEAESRAWACHRTELMQRMQVSNERSIKFFLESHTLLQLLLIRGGFLDHVLRLEELACRLTSAECLLQVSQLQIEFFSWLRSWMDECQHLFRYCKENSSFPRSFTTLVTRKLIDFVSIAYTNLQTELRIRLVDQSDQYWSKLIQNWVDETATSIELRYDEPSVGNLLVLWSKLDEAYNFKTVLQREQLPSESQEEIWLLLTPLIQRLHASSQQMARLLIDQNAGAELSRDLRRLLLKDQYLDTITQASNFRDEFISSVAKNAVFRITHLNCQLTESVQIMTQKLILIAKCRNLINSLEDCEDKFSTLHLLETLDAEIQFPLKITNSLSSLLRELQTSTEHPNLQSSCYDLQETFLKADQDALSAIAAINDLLADTQYLDHSEEIRLVAHEKKAIILQRNKDFTRQNEIKNLIAFISELFLLQMSIPSQCNLLFPHSVMIEQMAPLKKQPLPSSLSWKTLDNCLRSFATSTQCSPKYAQICALFTGSSKLISVNKAKAIINTAQRAQSEQQEEFSAFWFKHGLPQHFLPLPEGRKSVLRGFLVRIRQEFDCHTEMHSIKALESMYHELIKEVFYASDSLNDAIATEFQSIEEAIQAKLISSYVKLLLNQGNEPLHTFFSDWSQRLRLPVIPDETMQEDFFSQNQALHECFKNCLCKLMVFEGLLEAWQTAVSIVYATPSLDEKWEAVSDLYSKLHQTLKQVFSCCQAVKDRQYYLENCLQLTDSFAKHVKANLEGASNAYDSFRTYMIGLYKKVLRSVSSSILEVLSDWELEDLHLQEKNLLTEVCQRLKELIHLEEKLRRIDKYPSSVVERLEPRYENVLLNLNLNVDREVLKPMIREVQSICKIEAQKLDNLKPQLGHSPEAFNLGLFLITLLNLFQRLVFNTRTKTLEKSNQVLTEMTDSLKKVDEENVSIRHIHDSV
ncbi:hypothetical protein Ciccas_001262 [Cichlidogyrus casuarinus]|uniref:Uncharacterized protein n=1 Tax=Cichlidogyrus casuarinus TaxID=1844966 RepID=A0ABD2QKJ7_9PLAT